MIGCLPNAGPEPTIGTNGSTLAVEGVGLVTTVQPNGTIRRHLIPSRTVDTLAVTSSGDVVLGSQDAIALIRASGSN